METIRKGIPVSSGVVIGTAFLLDSEDAHIPRRFITNGEISHEVARFENALENAKKECESLQLKVAQKIGKKHAEIFGAHLEFLKDKVITDEITKHIRKDKFTPEYSVTRVLGRYVKKFQSFEEQYLSERAADIKDVQHRLLRSLLGQKQQQLHDLKEKVIIIAHDLSPSQAAALDKSKVLAFATDVGGRTSHTAIVARALEIPAVVGLSTITTDVVGGDTIIVDGSHGIIVIRPSEETLSRYQEIARTFYDYEENLIQQLRNLPACTTDNRQIRILGNIEFPSEIPSVLKRGGTGIGLYRTEFLYHSADRVPTEKDHFDAYTEAIRELGNKLITIRTLDLGADKFGSQRERNPFLGCRSIRFCLQNVSIFTTQIRAILRASAFGNTRIMFPLISTMEELQEAKLIVYEVMEELRNEDISFDKDIKIGIMIEVPSAALIANELAKECDFFSIGTNDLVQYALAVDRGNETVAHLFSPAHPAHLRLLKMIFDAAENNNIPVSMCGEMSGDVLYTMLLIGMGLTEFSISPAAILEVKKVIRSISYEDAKEVAERACSFAKTQEVMDFLREKTAKILPNIF